MDLITVTPVNPGLILKKLYVLPTQLIYMFLYVSENKQQLFPCAALKD